MINYYDDKHDLELVGIGDRTVAMYGATRISNIFNCILPDYFIDKNANDIKQINDIPVVTIEQFQNVKSRGGGVDFVITNTSDTSQNEIVKLLTMLYCNSDLVINIFAPIVKITLTALRQQLFSLPEYLENLKQCYPPTDNISQYINDLWAKDLVLTAKSYGRLEYMDYKSKYVNIENGYRKTVKQKSHYDNAIHMFGDSRLLARFSEDKETICSHLQSLVDLNDYSFEVNNYGIAGFGQYGLAGLKCSVDSIHLKCGDIVIFVFARINNINYSEEKLLYTINYLNDIHQYFIANNWKIYFIGLPNVNNKKHITRLEQIILDTQQHTVMDLNTTNDVNLINSYWDLIYLINEKYPYESFFIDNCHFHSRANKRIATEIFEILNLD
ncbi:MAG: hypothetical protein ATN34_00550 [Epulopiscium sp. Nele67-Bin002]|nr:MAG: hypothetical protein ATN34_00550 [Epulopiscium sp. Nele67-Bin002]